MPRQARLIPPGVVVHVVCRFVNSEFRFGGPAERQEYLERLGRLIGQTDWVVLHWALMSSHIHLVLVSGSCAVESLFKPLNTGTALWLNKRQGRHGPVFSSRPMTVICSSRSVGYVLAYLSNNPPRGGVVDLARESTWTSHRYYLEPRSAPEWLDVEQGLSLAGFASNARGRKHFDDFTNARRASPRDDMLNGRNIGRAHRASRIAAGAPVETAPPEFDLTPSGPTSTLPLVVRPDTPLRPAASISARTVLEATAEAVGLSAERLRSPSRLRDVCAGRRVAVIVWVRLLNRPSSEIATLLGISRPAASQLLSRSPKAHRAALAIAERVASQLLARAES